MALRPPPPGVWIPVERALPNVYLWFITSLVQAVGDAPGTPTSWFRDAVVNREAGGKVQSQHLAGLAVDAVFPPSEVPGVLQRARLLGLTAIDEGSHVHFQALPAGTLGRLGLLP